MSLNSFDQLVDTPTRCFKDSKTVIHLLFTNSQNLVKRRQVQNCDIGDHFAVECCINTKKSKNTFLIITIRDFRKFDAAKFFESAKNFDFHHITKVWDLADQFVPFKTQRHSNRSICWKSREVSLLMIEAKKAIQSYVVLGHL